MRVGVDGCKIVSVAASCHVSITGKCSILYHSTLGLV